MRAPTRTRNLALASCLVGAALVPLSFALAKMGTAQHSVLLIGGLMLFVFGGVAALVYQGSTRSYERFRIGKDFIARWTVDEQTWRDFLALDESLHVIPGQRMNELQLRKHRPPLPIHVLIGREAVEIDGDFHSFHAPGNPMIEYVSRTSQYPAYLEFGFYRAEASFPRDSGLRFPFPKSAESQAIKVQRHFEAVEAARAAQRPVGLVQPRLLYLAALAALVLAALTSGIGYWRFGGQDTEDLNVALMLGGILAGIGVLLLAAVVVLFRWFKLRRI